MADLTKYKAEWVELNKINFDNKSFQFRRDITEESVRELADSMSNDGQKFPVVLWRRNNGELQPVSGYRRISAAKSMGWEKVLSIIIPENEMPETEALRFNFIENIERKTLNFADIKAACIKLKGLGKSNLEIARLISKDEKQVRRYLAETGVGHCPTHERKNKNNYVKSSRNSFEEKLKIEPKPENTPILEEHINAVRKAWKEALKARVKGIGVRGQKLKPKKWQNVSGAGLDVFSALPKEALVQYKSMLDSGNTGALEVMLKDQNISLDQVRSKINELLNQ